MIWLSKFMLRVTTVFFCLLILISSSMVFAEDDFKIGGTVIVPGKRYDLNIDIPAGESDPSTFIPVTVISGTKPGPTLLIVAGVHGYEFAPILAAERLAEEVSPNKLAGTFVIVRIAHVPSFEARSPFVNPYDRKNLNRSFPGNPKGTQTERIAYALSTEIIPHADVVLDLHSGDGSEWLEAFVGVYGGPLATKYPQALSLAKAFGFPHIVRYKMSTQEQVDSKRSLNRQAVAEGLPTLLIEIGENGKREPEHIEAIVQGVKNSLISMKMVEGVVDVDTSKIRYFDGTSSVTAQNSGIWHPVSTSPRFVKQGDTIGLIRDYRGRLIETVKSPVEGYSLYGASGPSVKAGSTVVTIGQPKETL